MNSSQVTYLLLFTIAAILWCHNVYKIQLTTTNIWSTYDLISSSNPPFSKCDETKHTTNNNKNRRLNVLILYPDDWRHDSIGNENPTIRTPFLTKLAQNGIRFRQNAVTTSICWISRATLFTGLYGSEHLSYKLGCPHFVNKERWNTSWPYLLQTEANYTVGHVGKWQYYRRPEFDWARIHEGEHWYNVGGEQMHATEKTRRDVVDFLRERPKERPFALTVAFYPPKPKAATNKYEPLEHTYAMYKNLTIKEPYPLSTSNTYLPPFLADESTTGRREFHIRYGTSERYQDSMKKYYALVTQVDAECQNIFNELEHQQLLNDTMIIFTTDNGMFHGSHGISGKWYPYQESIRVPLIIYDPRMPMERRGGVDDESLTLNVDLARTILGAAGVKPPERMNGRDISDLYRNDDDNVGVEGCTNKRNDRHRPWREEFYYEFPPIHKPIPASTALIQKKYKYIHWPQFNYEELFDLENDPLEMDNLWRDPKVESILSEMRKRHGELRDEITATPREIKRYRCPGVPVT